MTGRATSLLHLPLLRGPGRDLDRCRLRTGLRRADASAGLPRSITWFPPMPAAPARSRLTLPHLFLPKEAAMFTQPHAHHRNRRSVQFADWIEDAAILAMLVSAAAILAAIVLFMVVI